MTIIDNKAPDWLTRQLTGTVRRAVTHEPTAPNVDQQPNDNVNHPAHYKFSAIEVIDALEAWDLPFHLANVIKYVARAGRKSADTLLNDLEKARWYLDRYINFLKAKKQ